MQKPRKRLGRGLSALIPDADMELLSRVARGELTTALPSSSTTKPKKKRDAGGEVLSSSVKRTAQTKSRADQKEKQSIKHNKSPTEIEQDLVEMVSVTDIEPNPYQPRRVFSDQELEELAQSIAEHGVLQPILLRPTPPAEPSSPGAPEENSAQYQLIAGERRWRASKAAQLDLVPAIIRRVSDQQALEFAVIENLQRHDISPVDAALAYRRLSTEFSLSQEEIAKRVGKSRSAVANTLRLLDLPPEALKAVSEGLLTEGHGRAILLAATDGARRAVFRRVLREKLSVRQTEELARSLVDSNETLPNSGDTRGPHLPPEIRRIEETLQKKLGTRVRLRTRKVGGQLTVEYFSNEELERLLKLLMR